MTKYFKLTLAAALAVSLSALIPVAANAATPAPQKVAFIGDWLTDSWSATFPANWIDYDQGGGFPPTSQISAAIAAKPSIIHIMIGLQYIDDDAGYNLVTGLLEEDLVGDITQAHAAGIPVVVGIAPLQLTSGFAVQQAGLEVYAIATKYGVPVINYSGAFSNAQTGYAGQVSGSGGTAQLFGGVGSFFTPSANEYSEYVPTPAGYAIMTMMAQTAFSTLNAQPKSLYLQDIEFGSEDTQTSSGCCATPSNVNTVSPGNTVQFYPVITYTNGVSGAGLNSNFLTGSNGAWTSSNPAVGFVNQSGQFWAFSQGTTIVKFTLPNGVWNEWIMYVGPPFAG
jgi:hypothetical protein